MSGQFEKIGLEAVMAIPLMLIYLIFNYDARLANIYDMKSLRSKHRPSKTAGRDERYNAP